MIALETVARFVRGFCVGVVVAHVYRNHGWEWLVVLVALWLSHLAIEQCDRSATDDDEPRWGYTR